MTLEYLFVSEENIEEIEHLKIEEVEINISKISDDSSWVVTFKTEKNNEKTAKKLSEIDILLEKYNPIVLINQSSDFYNQYRANYSPVISSAVERLSEFKRNVVFSGQAINEALKSEEWKNFCGLLDSLRND